MAVTTRYVVLGGCAVLAPSPLFEDRALADADPVELSTNSAAHWRFHLSSSVWRRNGLVLSFSGPNSLQNCAWTTSQSGRPPSVRNGVRSGHAAQSSSAALRPSAYGPSCDQASRPLSASTTAGAPPVDQASGSAAVGGSSLQHQALLLWLGPSTSASHVSGLSLLAGAASGIVAVFSGQDSHSAAQLSSCSEEASGRHLVPASPSAAWERPLPLAHLQAACLASVAAALVQLPRAWGEQAPGLPSLFLRSLNPNAHLGSFTPGTQPEMQSPQSWQRDSGPAGPAAEAAVRVMSLPPASCTAGGAWRAGRQSVAGAPPPAALAFAVGAAGAGTASAAAAALDEASTGHVYTVDRTDSDSCSSGSSAVHRTSVDRGSGSSPGDAAAGRWVGSAGVGPGRLALPPPGQIRQPAMGVAGAVAAAKEEEERAKEAEFQKVFGNPIRYCKLLFAGAMSAVVSRTCVAPLERIKMDLLLKNGTGDAFTTATQVLRTEGIAGFWKGNALNVLRTAPFKAVNFFSFDMYRTAFLALSGREENLERFLAGACAGVTATLVCFPLDVVRTRLMASVAGPRYGTGPFSTLAGILRNEGAAALYSGCLPAVIGMAPAGAVFYGVYDMLKHRHLEKLAGERVPAEGAEAAESSGAVQPPTLDPLYTLMYGAMAGAASELIVYPLEVIRRKMQLQSMALASMRQMGGMPHHHHHHPHMGHFGPAGSAAGGAAAGGRLAAAAHHHHMLPYHLGAQKMISTLSAAAVANSPGLARVAAAVTAILSTDGPRGFYSGLLPNMLQVLPSAALSYYTYDTLKTVLGAR